MVLSKFNILLHSKGFTQTTFANQIDVSPQVVSFYSCGERVPSLKTAYNMAKVLDISLDELAGYFIN